MDGVAAFVAPPSVLALEACRLLLRQVLAQQRVSVPAIQSQGNRSRSLFTVASLTHWKRNAGVNRRLVCLVETLRTSEDAGLPLVLTGWLKPEGTFAVQFFNDRPGKRVGRIVKRGPINQGNRSSEEKPEVPAETVKAAELRPEKGDSGMGYRCGAVGNRGVSRAEMRPGGGGPLDLLGGRGGSLRGSPP